MTAKKLQYSAVGVTPYHYPDGVIVPGQTALLTDSEAERGLASGQIALTPKSIKAKASPSEET